MSETKTAKRLTGGIIAIIVLVVCLCITTFALVYASVSVENNLFRTGEIKINLNDGKPVIREHEFLFEPGMTVVKDFFIENDSTWDVYYRLYLDNVSGGLSDVLTVTIYAAVHGAGESAALSGSRESNIASAAKSSETMVRQIANTKGRWQRTALMQPNRPATVPLSSNVHIKPA